MKCRHILFGTLFLVFGVLKGQQLDQAVQEIVNDYVAHAERLKNQQPDSSFKLCQKALSLSQSAGLNSSEASVYRLLGELFFHQAAYGQSIDMYYKAIALYEEQSEMQLALCYHELGKVYYKSKVKLDLAQEQQDKALSIYESLQDLTGIAKCYGSIGHLYEKRGDYDSALFYQERALETYRSIGDSVGIACILENIGSIYEDLEQYEEAMDHFENAHQIASAIDDQYLLVGIVNNIGDVYRKTKSFDEALIYTNKALILAKHLGERNQIISGYRDLGKIYHQSGKDSMAYESLEKCHLLYDKVYTDESAKQQALHRTLFQIENKNNEIELLEQRQHLNDLMKVIGALIFVLVVLIGIVVIGRQRWLMRKNSELHNEMEKAHVAERALINVELQNKKLSEQRLQDELKSKSKELTNFTLHTITKNQVLDELRDDLKKILEDDSRGYKKALKTVVKKIDTNFQKDGDWEDFRQIFEKVHESFFDNLISHTPDLSLKEKRLAALIRLNLTPEDISASMAISADSLRVARYRLRKRLGLSKGQKLESFLQEL